MPDLVHVFFSSVSYVPYAVLVYISIVFAPALAFFPRLTEKPIYAISIPIISLLIDAFFAALLFKFQCYTHTVVVSISIALTVVAMVRQYFYWTNHSAEYWQKSDSYILGINFVGVIPLLVMSCMTAFMDTDAIFSWNAWGQYYYLVHQHAAVFLPARGYPPFLPLILSYIYKFLGTTDYEGVAKAILILFPLTVMNAIALTGKLAEKSWLVFIFYIAMIAASLFSVMGYRFYSEGFADPLLAACLTLAVIYIILYSEEQKRFVLLLAVLTTMAASISKQPGFLWALFSFPLILILNMVKAKKYSAIQIIAIIAGAIPALCWILGPGSHFVQNSGVIYASTGSNTFQVGPLFDALGYSVVKYWVKMPWIFLLYVWSAYSAWQRRTSFLIYISYIIPGTILWFMLGSYDGRLGFQLLAICAVLIAYDQFYPVNTLWKNHANIQRIFQVAIGLGALSFVFFSINENYIKHGFVRGQLYPLNGPRTVIGHYFGYDADYIYKLIYLHSEKILWIPDSFVQSFFEYNNGLASVIAMDGNISTVYKSIITSHADYILIKEPATFPAEKAAKKLTQICPFLFDKLPLVTQRVPYNYRIFAVEYAGDNVQKCNMRIQYEV